MPQNSSSKYQFSVDWGGVRKDFLEVSGLSIEHSVIEYREGGMPDNAIILMPGLRKFQRIVLKRGIVAGDTDFYKWMNTIQQNSVERRDIVIQLKTKKGIPVMAWKVHNAWPSKIQTSDLKADANEVAIETIELVHEGLTIEAP